MSTDIRECIDLGFIEWIIGRHDWSSIGIYKQLNGDIVDVRCVEYECMNLVMVF